MISIEKGGGGVDTENSNRNSMRLSVAKLAPYGKHLYIQPIKNISFNVGKGKKINETVVPTAVTSIPCLSPSVQATAALLDVYATINLLQQPVSSEGLTRSQDTYSQEIQLNEDLHNLE